MLTTCHGPGGEPCKGLCYRVLEAWTGRLGNVKEEFLAELSHIPLALLAVMAGWSRWLEIRLPGDPTRLLSRIWPLCFTLIGAVLILYRES